MMKACHVEEAHKLLKALKVLEEQIAQLKDTKDLQINWFNRSVTVKHSDPKFGDLRQSMLVILNNQRANLVRRANQIDLLIDPVVILKAS